VPASDPDLLDEEAHEALAAGEVERLDAGGNPRREVTDPDPEAILAQELAACRD
jgi:hypothetical protein